MSHDQTPQPTAEYAAAVANTLAQQVAQAAVQNAELHVQNGVLRANMEGLQNALKAKQAEIDALRAAELADAAPAVVEAG